MKKVCIALLFTFYSVVLTFAINPKEIRDIMDKTQANVGDALYLITSFDQENITPEQIDIKNNPRLLILKKDSPLDVGSFSIIAIELKKVKGGLLYQITGFSKYAAESLVYEQIIPAGTFWNRILSGKELVEFATALRVQ